MIKRRKSRRAKHRDNDVANNFFFSYFLMVYKELASMIGLAGINLDVVPVQIQ